MNLTKKNAVRVSELNNNQQTILDHMKRDYKEHNISPAEVPILLFQAFENEWFEECEKEAFESLTEKQEAETVRAFMDWIIESEEA